VIVITKQKNFAQTADFLSFSESIFKEYLMIPVENFVFPKKPKHLNSSHFNVITIKRIQKNGN